MTLFRNLMLWITAFCGPLLAGDGFQLKDYLGREWRNESVRFLLTPENLKHIDAGHALLGPNGKRVAYQRAIQAPGQPTAIEFLADLNPMETRSYVFDTGNDAPNTDLIVDETDSSLRISNSLTGIAIRKKLLPAQGPIEALRLSSGKWIGTSRLDPALVPAKYSATVVAKGPVFIEILCSAEFGGGGSWQTRFRLNANEPVVLVDEVMSLGALTGTFSVSLTENFNPDKVFFRSGMDTKNISRNLLNNIEKGTVYKLEPWLHWYESINQGPVFSVFNDTGTDLLSVAAREASIWIDPKIPVAQRANPRVHAIQDDTGLHLDFPLRNGQRKWMLSALSKESTLAILKEPYGPVLSPLPYRYLIKHGHFPLNTIKDYVLEWNGDSGNFPRMLVTKAQVNQYRARVTAAQRTTFINNMDRYLREELTQYNMGEAIAAYFATEDARLGAHLLKGALQMMQLTVESFTIQEQRRSPAGVIYGEEPYGAKPHNQQYIGAVPLLVDAALSTGLATPEQRRQLLGQLAFVGYSLNRPDYWSVERGFAGTPNMTTSVNGYRIATACIIPSHPNAAEWIKDGMAELKSQLTDWSDSNGGWLEAPHYAMVSFDQILSSFVMAHNAGFNEYLFDPKVKLIMNWFSKVATPPDSRARGKRHQPPIGHGYISEPCGEFGIVASLYKNRDPNFASEMQWMYHQQGSYGEPGIGGSYPGFAGYRQVLLDETILEKAPAFESEKFPNVGVILRNHFPSARESHLHLLAGSFGNGYRSHWDDDSGSFTLYGKGRIIADDWGYGVYPADDHNLLDAPEVRANPIFRINTFAPSKSFDYVSGARGPWQRQIVFLKDADSAAPNYFVFCDTAKTAAPGTWRLWLTAAQVALGKNSARVEGKDDVDTDVFFAATGAVELRTELRTRRCNFGIGLDGKEGPTETTQVGLMTTPSPTTALTYILYPRLKTEKTPGFTSLADGKAIKIESDSGTDYVFISSTPFAFKDEVVSFEGKVGAVRLRGKQLTLNLGEGGTIRAYGESLTATAATSKVATLKQ